MFIYVLYICVYIYYVYAYICLYIFVCLFNIFESSIIQRSSLPSGISTAFNMWWNAISISRG